MVSKVIEVTDLTKHYRRFGREKTAVDRLTFSVAAGSVVGFLGRNGAGKNTTILAMLDLISPSVGEILLFGQRHTSQAIVIIKSRERNNFERPVAPADSGLHGCAYA